MRTIPELVSLNHRRHPRREAVVAVDGRLTHGELAERAWGLARELRRRGVRPGDRVGVLAGNTLFNVTALLGVAVAGGVYVAYNWRWTPAELAHGIAEVGTRLVLAEDTFAELADQGLALLAEDGAPPHLMRQAEVLGVPTSSSAPPAAVRPEDPLCILYTGGSTGTPKGVVLSHRSSIANALNEMLDCGLGVGENNRGLIVTPLFHSAGLQCWLITHYLAGATVVLAPKFDQGTVVELVAAERATNTFMIPNMMRALMQQGTFADPAIRGNLRAVHTGAGLLRMPDKQLFAETLPDADLYFRYGLTEAGPMVSRLRPEDMTDVSVDGSIGQEYLLVEAEVLDPDGRVCPPGELGEMCVRGPSVMTGYHDRPEATAEALRGGWLHTGDLVTRDERGYFFFRDRLKDMIKSGGENVYAAEIEQVLYLHPQVLEAAVVGVPHEKWDEEVRAVVVRRSSGTVTAEELRLFLRQHLAGYKIPKEIVFVGAEDLPRSAAGKLVKAQMKRNLGWS